MRDSHKNFSYSAVATAPSPAVSGTSLIVTAGDGVKFPTPPFNATVWPVGLVPIATNAEIIRVTALATDTLTIARSQEGSSARTIVTGDQIAATITAKTLTDAEDLIYDGDFAAGPTYQDGEVVVSGGIAYLCVKPTTVAPVAWPGGPTLAPTPMPAYVTSLPASPIDGQEAILVDSLTAPTYTWRFRYNAGSTSAYKWEFLGGSPKRVRTDAQSAALAVGNWTAELPAFLVPRAGDYLASSHAMFINSGGAVLLGLAVMAPALLNNSTTHALASTYQGLESSDNECPGMAAGGQISIGYYASTAGQTFQSRQITVVPVRVA